MTFPRFLGLWAGTFLFVALFGFVDAARADPINYTDILNRPTPTPTKRIAYGRDQNQFGELWLPDGDGSHPLVVMIHGGCWQASLPGLSLMSPLAEDLRENGIAVWNVEYRRLGQPGGGYPGTFLDIGNAVDFVRALSAPYHLDISKLTIIGHSAGAQLALWAAGRNRFQGDSPLYIADPVKVTSVVSLAGIDDLKSYKDSGPAACGGPDTINQLINAAGRTDVNPYSDTSPSTMLPLGVKQVVVFGAFDPIVPSAFGHAYALQAKAAGDPVDMLVLGGAGHFEVIDPTSESWAQIKPHLLPLVQTTP